MQVITLLNFENLIVIVNEEQVHNNSIYLKLHFRIFKINGIFGLNAGLVVVA